MAEIKTFPPRTQTPISQQGYRPLRIGSRLRNYVDTDEGITSNTNDYQGLHGGLHHLGNSGYTGQAGRLRFGDYYLWVEAATGKLWIKSGAPSSDSDGTVVGTQT